MFIFGYLFKAIGGLLSFLLNIYIIMIIIHSLLTWFNVGRNKYIQILQSLVQPYLSEIKRILPIKTIMSGVDFTPIIGVLILYLTDQVIMRSLIRLGESLL